MLLFLLSLYARLARLLGASFRAKVVAVVIKFVTLRLCWLRAKDCHKLLQVRLVRVGWVRGEEATQQTLVGSLRTFVANAVRQQFVVIEIGFKFSETANFLAQQTQRCPRETRKCVNTSSRAARRDRQRDRQTGRKRERDLFSRIDNRYGSGIYERPGSHVRAEHKSEKHRAIFLC